jgi:serine/threonine protein kinase
MGEVYRAGDTRLGREVAIKVLPPELAHSSEALARFEREAKAVAALSHPNTLALYDIGVDQGVSFVVTELLEGETLRIRLARHIHWRKAIEIGLALADGLAAAHSKGIVHRDLKPENIFVTFDARVKILDFGLVRFHRSTVPVAESSVPTETNAGTVLGTVGYMSPEQVRGQRADPASDIFSLGCVLYEMLSGQRAFARATAAQTLAAILEVHPPDLSSSVNEVPSDLQRIVMHCLEKNPHERFQSARDLGFALKAVTETPSTPAVAASPRRLSPRVWMAVLPIALVSVGLYWVNRPLTAIDSLAVLPFANASGDPNAEYLSDGLTEQLINSLSQVPKLRVAGRSLAFRYKGHVDPQEAQDAW